MARDDSAWSSDFPQIARFEHEISGVHLAIDLMVTAYQANALDLGALLEGDGRTFDLQILDQDHRIAIGQGLAIGVFDQSGRLVFRICGDLDGPFVATIGADEVIAVRISVFLRTKWAGGEGGHNLQGESEGSEECTSVNRSAG